MAQLDKTIAVNFKNNSLDQVIQYMEQVTGVEFYPDWKALDLIGIRQDTEVELELGQVTADSALNRILEQVGDDLDRPEFAVEDGVVVISSDEALRKKTLTIVYDIRDLLFEVPYFDRKAYLTQSGQLYAEASAMALGKVYTFGPTFRAEKSKTRRHLTEFWMLEPEVAFADLDDICQLAEDMICRVVQHVLGRCGTELADLERDVSKLEAIQAPFPRITYDEASKILLEHPDSEFVEGDDFGAPDETILSERYDRPLMVTHYPKDVKAFYMKRDPENEDRVLCVDVLGPEGVGEIIGGSQREDDLDLLEGRIREHELPMEAFQWFLDLRRYGSVPHSGFGLGLERFVGWICGVPHIRECIPFPRTIVRLEP